MSTTLKKSISNFTALAIGIASLCCAEAGNPGRTKTTLFTETYSGINTTITNPASIEPRLSFVFSPREDLIDLKIEASSRIRPRKTPWGPPWQHKELVTNMSAILVQNNIIKPSVKVRMIAHAIVASGWRQNVWNYNAWGVQRGSWRGPYHILNTIEETDQGTPYQVKDAPWRAFRGWAEAVRDYHNRISADSKRPSYRQAYRHLHNPGSKADAAYWAALGEGNYYTAQKFTAKKFAALCHGIRQILAQTQNCDTAL